MLQRIGGTAEPPVRMGGMPVQLMEPRGGDVSENAELRVLVSIATYNERENLPELMRQIHEVVPQVDILIIDDNSPDGTGAWADEAAAADPRVRVLHRPGKLGLGTA